MKNSPYTVKTTRHRATLAVFPARQRTVNLKTRNANFHLITPRQYRIRLPSVRCLSVVSEEELPQQEARWPGGPGLGPHRPRLGTVCPGLGSVCPRLGSVCPGLGTVCPRAQCSCPGLGSVRPPGAGAGTSHQLSTLQQIISAWNQLATTIILLWHSSHSYTYSLPLHRVNDLRFVMPNVDNWSLKSKILNPHP